MTTGEVSHHNSTEWAAARSLHAAGLAVLPVQPGEKRPAVQWKDSQGERPALDELERLFRRPGVGVGAIMGTVSGNLEMLEVEGRAAASLPVVEAEMKARGLADLWARVRTGWEEASPSGGLHWFYRIDGAPVPGNTAIARRPRADGEKGVEILVETRGAGGFAVLAPTDGTHHESGRAWVRLSGAPDTAATITPGEREQLHAVLRDVLDETPVRAVQEAPRTTAEDRTDTYGSGRSPVEDFNARTDWADVLEPAGWTFHHQQGRTRYWTRPEKDPADGFSASTGRAEDGDRLFIFSTSTDLPAEEPLTKAYAAAQLQGVSMSTFSSQLRADGYGDPLERRPEVLDLTGLPRAGERPQAPREAPQAGGKGEEEVTDRDEYARTLQARLVFHRADRAARRQLDAEERSAQAVATDVPRTTGAAFILDQPDKVPARWGQDEEILWAKGEALMIVGPPGVGKTTLVGQLVHALLGLQGEVLGYPVEPVGRVLYLAMDRPRQIGRALARCFTEAEREALDERLTVHQGPPPADLAQDTDKLLEMAQAAGADVVIVDSLKDAAVGLSEDAVGAGYNRARQKLLAAGIDLVELHHQKKNGANGGKPNTLPDVYGSTWLTSGAGSVVLLWADVAGASVVQLSHLKPVMEPVGPFDVIHDHTAGRSQVDGQVDLMALAGANVRGVTVGMAAEALFGVEKPSKDQREKARRRIRKLVDAGRLEVAEPISDGKGHDLSTYRPRRGPAGAVLDLGGLR